MTQTTDTSSTNDTRPTETAVTTPVASDLPVTRAEIDELQRRHFFIPEAEVTADSYPQLRNLSAGSMWTATIRPVEPQLPDYVAIDMPLGGSLELAGAVARWNMLWEAGQFRRRFFDGESMPAQLERFADRGDINLMFVPRTPSRYFEYSPLFHLLSKSTCQRFGLPLLRAGAWPFMVDGYAADRFLDASFVPRLEKAWANTVWRHLSSGSPQSAFSSTDPIRLLSHNLDYWVPAATATIQNILSSFPEVDNGIVEGPVTLEDGSVLEGALRANPRQGGYLWAGEEWASWVVEDVVEAADRTGQLRGLLDAVRSHRVEDDFSSRWSFAKEDFERKLYRKRNKVSVNFVELTDVIPIQGADSEAFGNVVTSDFLALLDPQQRRIVIALSSGYRQHEIAEELGYANHTPVTKKLAKIRQQAEIYFQD